MASAQPRSFADLLRRYRLAAGLTQEELAEQAGVSARAVSALENGERRAPHKDTVAFLAKALGLTPAEHALLASAARSRLPAAEGSAPIQPPGRVSGTQRSTVPLVGRRQELSILDRLLANEGPPFVLFEGESGIGKSRLLDEGARRAEEHGWMIIAGTCHRRSGQEPYEPFVSALTHFLSARSPAQQRLDLHGCHWLVRLLPELAETAIAPAPSWTLPPEQERRLMFGALARFLANIAGPIGTLLVLDDLQWAGGDALDLLAFLLRAPRQPPLQIVGAARDTDVEPLDPLPLLLSDLAREGLMARTRLPLLERDDAKGLLSALLVEEAGDHNNRRRQLDAILDRAGGLPLFLVSCAQDQRMATGAGTGADGSADTVPWSATESIRQRLTVLPAAAQEMLALAAVAGRNVSRPVLVAAAKASSLDEGSIVAGLEASRRARLLHEAADGSYVFSHDLIRETVDTSLGGARRAALHRRIAHALEGLPRAEGHAAELAWHWMEGDEPARALPYAIQAGDQARAKYAHADAERHYAQAVANARAIADHVREASTLERRADARYRLGRFAEAVTDLDDAAALNRQLGDWERLVWSTTERAKAGDPLGLVAESLERVEALASTLAAVAVGRGEAGTPVDGPRSLAEQMRLAATILTPRTVARLYLCLTSRMVILGRLDEVPWTSERAEAYATMARSAEARESGQEQQRLLGMERPTVMLSLVLSFRSSALQAQECLREAATTLEDAVRLAHECRDIDALGMALGTLADVYESLAEPGHAKEVLCEMLTVATDYDDVRYVYEMEWRLGQIALGEGDWAEARTRLERALASCVRLGDRRDTAQIESALAELARGQEQPQ